MGSATGRASGHIEQLVGPLHAPGVAAQAAGTAPLADEGGIVSPALELLRTDGVREQVERLLKPSKMDADRFLRVCETMVTQRPNFLLVDRRVLLTAVLQCAGLGLEPNSPLGQMFLDPVPPEGDGAKAWGIERYMGYKGMVQLVHRSPLIESVRVNVVREGDEYDYDQGSAAYIMHKQALTDRGAPLFFYATWRLTGASVADFEIVTLDEIEERKAYSPAVIRQDETSAWFTNELMMQRKTVLRIVFPWLPVSAEAAVAAADDDTLIEADADLPEPELVGAS